MPLTTSSYWSGSFAYTSTLAMQRKLTYDTRTSLLYDYQSELMPTRIPLAQLSNGRTFRVQAESGVAHGGGAGARFVQGDRAQGDGRRDLFPRRRARDRTRPALGQRTAADRIRRMVRGAGDQARQCGIRARQRQKVQVGATGAR